MRNGTTHEEAALCCFEERKVLAFLKFLGFGLLFDFPVKRTGNFSQNMLKIEENKLGCLPHDNYSQQLTYKVTGSIST